MSDIVDTSPLGIERTERIAGDEALNSRLDSVTTELQGTQESVTTEVLHRSEGDLVIQRILEGYIQELLEGKSEDFERYIEFQNSQNLNYADVRNFVSSIRTALADEIRNLSDSLMNNLQANDTRYNKLVSDVDRYLEILSDITLDSNQITLDNGELRAGAWTILSQARQWDLDIINRLNGLTASVGESLKDAVEDIQNQLPSTEETITKAIEELSNSPLIKNLSDLLNQSIENDTAYQNELLEQARQHANDMAQLAEDMRAEALAKAQAMEDYMAGEVTARITEVTKEVAARKEAIDLLTEDMLTRVDQDKADFQADMLAVANRIKSAEDGLTSEIQHRKDGDSSTLNSLNTYKVSNDSAITGLSTSLSNNVTKTNANTTLITGLTSRLDTAEDGIESATTAAADAMSKATTAVSANSALSLRVDALAASLTESEGTVVDVNAFNALKAEVNTVKGTVTGLVEDVTALESNYTSVNNKVTSQGTAIGTLNTKMSTAENGISQSANDITLLKTDISSINAGLLTKVDSQAFSQLSSDVSELDGKYTTQAGLVTDLRGSLDTTNVNVGNAASAAQNALNTAGSKGKVIFGTSAPAVEDRLSQNLWIDTTGNANTPKRWNGSAWVVVTDKVATDALAAANAATNLANTKADTSAFNSLDQKVTVMDGKVSTNTNSITSLNGKIAIVEGGLATKLDSSAIVNYYTKQQADDKALSTAAGEISKYDASLVIGGVNLVEQRKFIGGTQNPKDFTVKLFAYPVLNAAAVNSMFTEGETYTISFEYEIVGKPVPSTLNANQLGFILYSASNTSAHGNPENNYLWWDTTSVSKSVGYKGKITKTFKVNVLYPDHQILVYTNRYSTNGIAPFDNDTVRFTNFQIEKGTKATAWSPSPSDVQNALDANATAISNTNTEVGRVDGKTTVNANSITGLTSRMGLVEGQVSTKAEASALQNYYTKTEAAANATTVAAGEVAKYDASLVIGGTNLFSFAGAVAGYTSSGSITNSTASHQTMTALIPLGSHKSMTYQVWNPAAITNSANTNRVAFFKSDGSFLSFYTIPQLNGATYQTTLIPIPELATHARLGIIAGPAGGARDANVKIKIEFGNKATDWSESDSTIVDSLTANATAISNTNAEVARVDGRVTTESNRITTLAGRVSTAENGLALKADVAALNNIYTKTETDAKAASLAAGEISKYSAALKIGNKNLLAAAKWKTPAISTVNKANGYGFKLVDTTSPYTGAWGMYGPWTELEEGTQYVFSFKIKALDATPLNVGGHITGISNAGADSVYLDGIKVEGSRFSDGTPVVIPNDEKYHLVVVLMTKKAVGADHIYIQPNRLTSYTQPYNCSVKEVMLTEGNAYSQWVEPDEFIQEQIDANSEALISTNAEVKRINGQVISHADQILNLTSGIAGKADASALNNIYTKAQTDAKVESVAAGKIEAYKSALVIGGSNQLHNSEAQRVGGNEYLMYESSAHLKQFYDDNLGKDITISFEIMVPVAGYVQVYSSNGSAHTFNTGTPWLAANTWTRVAVTVRPTRKPEYDTQARSTLEFFGTYNTGRRTFVRKVKLEKGNVATDWSPSFRDQPDMSGYATATAVSTLDTKVERVDDRVDVHASQLLTLTSDNSDNKNALTVQAKVLNGVKASYMVKMETNGVVGGFGMIQESGSMGGVFTSFGVNADAFFIGSPSTGKKPFIVSAYSQIINGVTYPAGTWIDVALIASATIGTAKIADAAITNAKIANIDASKITTGVLDAGRIRVGSNTQFDTGYNPVAVLDSAKTYVDAVEIGSRNLLKDSALIQFKGSDSGNGGASVVVDDFVRLTPVNAGNVYGNSAATGGLVTASELIAGEQYTYSVMVKTAMTSIGLYCYSGGNHLKSSIPLKSGNVWERVSFTFTQSTARAKNFTFLAGFHQLQAGVVVEYRNFKLEKGNKATDWTPAPEDVDAAIESKSKTFTTQPTTPYASGDIYRNGASIYVCTTARASGSYVAADWTLVGDVTSANTAANANQLGGKASATVLNDISNAANTATTAKGTADAANNQVVLWKYGNTTYIDGGKIYANSITANQISTAAINTIALAAQNVTIYKDPTKPYGERMVQSGGLIQIYDANNRLRVRLGIW